MKKRAFSTVCAVIGLVSGWAVAHVWTLVFA